MAFAILCAQRWTFRLTNGTSQAGLGTDRLMWTRSPTEKQPAEDTSWRGETKIYSQNVPTVKTSTEKYA